MAQFRFMDLEIWKEAININDQLLIWQMQCQSREVIGLQNNCEVLR